MSASGAENILIRQIADAIGEQTEEVRNMMLRYLEVGGQTSVERDDQRGPEPSEDSSSTAFLKLQLSGHLQRRDSPSD